MGCNVMIHDQPPRILFIALIAAMLNGGCSRADAPEPPMATRVMGAPVPLLTVRDLDGEPHPATAPLLGVLVASQSTEISAETAGILATQKVHIGQVVAKGDVLLQLDAQLLRQERDELNAQLDGALAQHRSAQLEAQSAADIYSRRNDLTDNEKKEYLAREELERIRVEMLRAKERERQSAAQIKQKHANLALIQLRLARTELRAPWPGVVAAIYATSGATVTSGQPLLRLVSSGPALLRFVAPVSRPPQRGQRVCLALEDATKRQLTAQVTYVAPEVDEAMGAVVAEARLLDALPVGPYLGMQVQVDTVCKPRSVSALID
jgi:RND family efflux transporter MFP subunit